MVMLPDKDSNPDTQNQNLLYYHYTIGQYAFKEQKIQFSKRALHSGLSFLVSHRFRRDRLSLPDQDSNLGRQNQNL